MLDLSTNQINFIQMQTTIEQSMKDFVSNKNGFTTLESSAWNFLAPEGKPKKISWFSVSVYIFAWYWQAFFMMA